MIVLPMITATLSGLALLLSSFVDHRKGKQQESPGTLHWYVGVCMLLTAALAFRTAWSKGSSLTLFHLMDRIPVSFRVDEVSGLFLSVTTIVWTAVCFYSFRYMEHEGEEKRFYGFFLLAFAVLTALDCAGNLITFYFFYELMTLTTMPLVLHGGTREAVMAGLKYLFYSMAGAYLALFGIFLLYSLLPDLTFTAGGVLVPSLVKGREGILFPAIFLMLVGFGAKAGMFPLHAWLPAAHPVAPAPASAALSAIIVKCGVLAIVRCVYYIIGPDYLRGTWVQKTWIILILITILMGSLLAYREKIFKKRLAYSTVSQVSYILLGLAMLTPQAFTGSMLHMAGHALVKCALFMTAGIFILDTDRTRVEEYEGIGRTKGLTLGSYTLAALSLIGIPPTAGFISKWYLAQGSLRAQLGVLSYVGPVVLLVSALLTAGYLLPIVMKGFFPGEECRKGKQKEKPELMNCMVLILAVLALLVGIFPTRLIEFIEALAAQLMTGGL